MVKIIDGKTIETKKEDFNRFNNLEVEVGTNCPMGGDSGHGGRTYFRLEDLGSTALEIKIIENELKKESGIELILEGDSECITLIQALEYAAKNLKKIKKENEKIYREKLEIQRSYQNSLNK